MSATLDVSDAFCEEFLDTFTLHRRLEQVTSHGRPQVTETVTANQLGVITAASPNDLQRWPEADISLKSITITTQVRLQLASPGIVPPDPVGSKYKADIIEWGGNYYQVGLVEDYSRYAVGYLWCIAQTIDYTPAAPTPNPLG